MSKPKDFSQALSRTQWLCSQQEKCAYDIRLKLTQWSVEPTLFDKIIASLINDGFINEERFALSFARDKAKFYKWGPRKIEMALRVKRIASAIIENAISETEAFFDESSLTDILSKKAKTIKYKDKNDFKTKLIRFGISKGFDYEKVKTLAYSIVNNTFV